MLTHSRKTIAEEGHLLTKKQIYKPKQKNQFTQNNKFIEEFQKKKKEYSKKELIVIQIPTPLQSNNVFRLHSNVQLPRNARSNQLGCLNINQYSYNYKVNRVDRIGKLVNATLDPIDRPFIPVEVVKEMMYQGGEKLGKTFWDLHCKKLDKNKYQIIEEDKLHEFENNLTKPFVAFVSKVEQDKIVTLHKVCNEYYLNCLGLDSKMYIHYVQETGLLPLPLFFNENDYNSQHLSMFFTLNTLNFNVNELLATNYHGQQFPVKVTFYNYYCYDREEQCYFEYLFFVWDIDQRWVQKQKVLQNHKHYFNLKELPTNTNEELTEIHGLEQRCGFKSISKG